MSVTMKITVCIGSSCHLKGSRQVIEILRDLIHEYRLEDKIEMSGTFCVGNCQNGVCLMLDDRPYSLSPETTREFFKKEVLSSFTS